MRNDCVQRNNRVISLWIIHRCKKECRIERKNSRRNITILKETLIKFSKSNKPFQEVAAKTGRQSNVEQRVKDIHTIATTRKLTSNEEK